MARMLKFKGTVQVSDTCGPSEAMYLLGSWLRHAADCTNMDPEDMYTHFEFIDDEENKEAG
jgi:hypothetical protein